MEPYKLSQNTLEGYFLRLQEHIETTIAKQKISSQLAKIA